MDATAVSDESDRDLLARWCEARDDGAFAALVERHRPLVVAVCRRELRDPAEIDDVAQEVFIVLAEEGATIRGAVGAWLRTVAVHRCLNQVRARQRRRLHEARGAGERAPAPEPVGEDEELVTACLAELDPGERDLLVKLFFLGHSQAEVARSAQVSALVVHRRVKSALVRLRERFARRGRRVAPAVLVLLLAAGDRALAASACAVPAAGVGLALAGAGMAAAVALAVVLFGRAAGGAAPRTVPAPEPAVGIPQVTSATAAATAAGIVPATPAVPVAGDGWGQARSEEARDGRLVLGDPAWQSFGKLRVREAPGATGITGSVEAWLAVSEPLTTSPFAQEVGIESPAILRLSGRAWRVTSPPGRRLLIFSSSWAEEGASEQVVVTVPPAIAGRQVLWGVSRQAVVPDQQGGRLLSVSDNCFLDHLGKYQDICQRDWVWRPVRKSLRSVTVEDTIILAGWTIRPLLPATVGDLLASCSATSGSVVLTH